MAQLVTHKHNNRFVYGEAIVSHYNIVSDFAVPIFVVRAVPHLSVCSVTLTRRYDHRDYGPAAAARTDNYNEAGPLSAAVTMVVAAAVQHAKNIRPKVVAGMIYPATHFHGPSFFAGIRRASIIIEYVFFCFSRFNTQ